MIAWRRPAPACAGSPLGSRIRVTYSAVTRLEVGYSARSGADLAGLTVLHCDKDFDLIASVTGQPAEWLAAPWPLPGRKGELPSGKYRPWSQFREFALIVGL